MPVGTVAVQGLFVTGVTGQAGGIFALQGGMGGAFRIEEQVSRRVSLGVEGMGGAGGGSSLVWLGSGRAYGHLNPGPDWLALRFGLGAGFLAGGVPYVTSDASVEVSKIFAYGFGGYIAAGAAASGVMRDNSYLEDAGFKPAFNRVVPYVGGSVGVMEILLRRWQITCSLTALADPTGRDPAR